MLRRLIQQIQPASSRSRFAKKNSNVPNASVAVDSSESVGQADALNRPHRSENGVALLIAIACLMLIMYFAIEISYDSNVEYLVNAQGVQKIKAYYAAKSGVALSLLRIKGYQKAKQLGASLGANPSSMDIIWKQPFAWPLPIQADTNAVDKDLMKNVLKESILDSQYFITIEDEGSKLDINDLNSKSEPLRKKVTQALLNIFAQRKLENEKFAQDYSSFRFEDLIAQMTDWQTSKSEGVNGGDKRGAFAELNSASQSDYYPPNRSFRTISELHFLPLMNDELFDILESRITVHGMKGINPNLATAEVLKSLDPAMTDEAVSAIIKRRDDMSQGGPFKTEDEFWTFITASPQNIRLINEDQKAPLVFDPVINFRIRSTGTYGQITREITAIVMDFDKTAAKVKTILDDEKKKNNPTPTPTASTSPTATPTPAPPPKGPPRIVFWSEK